MSRKIILHCGAPKTGSTSFQHMLYENRERMLKAGFFYPGVSRKKREEDDIRIVLSNLKGEGNRKKEVRQVRKLIERLFAESGAHTLLISNEGLLGKPAIKGNKTFLPKAAESARLMAEALDGYDVEVRFFIRDFAGFLPSWYVQQVRMGNDMDFEPFARAYNFRKATWAPAVAALREHFGADRVEVYDHADLVKDAHGVFSRAFPTVMAALGEAGRNPPNKNSSIGRGMVSAYRRWNGIAERIGWSQKSRKTIQHLGRRYVLLPFERFSRSEKIRFDPETAKTMTARYRADIEAIKAAAPTPTL
ncbi:MAG: hypothetical protein KDJ87_00590 [Rhizobiaceae bacterium]|nr:hypothetical protein [Rhizobiaceae bacterium]